MPRTLTDVLMGKQVPPLLIPVSPGREVTLVLPGMMTEAEWEQFHKVLDVMKIALTKEADERPAG